MVLLREAEPIGESRSSGFQPVDGVCAPVVGELEVMTAAKMFAALSLWYGLWAAVEVWL